MHLNGRSHGRELRVFVLILCGVLASAVVPSFAQAYSIGPGDRLAVSVWGFKDLTAEVVVLPDGTISLPLIGQVRVAGLSVDRMRDELSRRYADFVKDPRVTVVVENMGTITVSVVGEVAKPGTVTLVRQSRVLEAIAASGGLTPDAAANAEIVRATGKVIPVNDLDATLKGDAQANPRLEAGDVVIIREDRVNVVSITGQVNKPGVVLHLRQAPTVLEALSLAGGLTDHAALQGKIRRKSGETVAVDLGGLLLRGDLSANVRLAPGDQIVVPDGPAQVFVVGGVKSPGAFRVSGDISALEALSMAGGVDRGTANGKVLLIHRAAVGPREAQDGRPLSAASSQDATAAAAASERSVETLQLQDILRGGSVTASTTLHPGDVLYVQESALPSIFGRILVPILSGVASFIYLFR